MDDILLSVGNTYQVDKCHLTKGKHVEGTRQAAQQIAEQVVLDPVFGLPQWTIPRAAGYQQVTQVTQHPSRDGQTVEPELLQKQ